jgi:preprotein translocase subunit SecD
MRMPKNLLWKWIAIVCVMAASLAAVSGLPTSKNELIANLQKNIRLGLDLRGGSHIVLQIQVQDAFKAEADLAMDRLREVLAKESISYNSIDRNEPASIDTANTIQVNIKGLQGSKSGDLRRIVRDAVGDEWNLSADGSSTDYRLNLRPEAAAALRESTLAQAASILEKKVNGLGVAEATVQRRGGAGSDAEIVVQIPGVDDPARVKSILQTSAMLELSEVKGGPYSSHAEAVAANNGALPLNSRLVPDGARKGASSGSEKPLWLLSRSPVVTGRDLRTAQAQQSPTSGSWETSFVLTQDAASRFERFTGSHIGTRLAIVLDNSVISAPTIEGKIADSGVINNIGSQQDAADLALNLRSGSLPAGVKPMDDRTIGPSLGADSIRHGVTAGLVGLALVIVSMIAYYRGAGLNAVFALLLNTLLTVAALSLIDATWTLPGIAGLVLSIGMAVDSNVLIFERIKEELRSGKAVPPAIGAGFDRALLTIIDTHVTTVVASAFLFIFGTGPVKGFAVTLVIGLIANLFTAVYVSRAIFSLKLWRTPRLSTLSIGTELFGQTNIDFLSKRAWTLGLSVVALLVSIASLIVKGGPNYGLDFRGGTQMYVRFDPKPPIDELRQVLTAKLPHASIQESTQSTGDFIIGTELAEESTLEQARQTVEDTLRVRYGNTGNKLDLNTATQAAVLDRLRSTLPGMSDEVLRANVSRILDYRNKETGGIIRDFNEIANLSGVEPQVVTALLQESGLGSFNIRSAGMVGPKAGEELRRQALLATGCALAGMLAYVAFRFRLISGTVAILATIHDVIITLGLFSLTNREIDLTIVAALLTLIGYSMNDKIVVFDRVRENMQHGLRRGQSFLEIVNLSINQTLSRTLLTAGPTLLACVSLYFLGGEVLNGIAFALFTGIVVGTYSSIFVASAMLVMWEQRRKQGSTTGRTVASSSPITVATR